jgi:glycosyltransferase involved in cell wall biosynthesis
MSATRPASSTDIALCQTAVVIPCLNEAETVGSVVTAFRRALPDARILVVDNGSSDTTAEVAAASGAEVIRESRRGKGHALIRGFQATRGAEAVLIVDGDGTYSADDATRLREALARADMVIGTRLATSAAGAFSASHTIGNRLFISLVRLLFGVRTSDLFSGYRAFSRRFIDVTALIAQGFEIEAELSLQAAAQGFVVAELPVAYRPRPGNSRSKLHTYRDGYRILLAVLAAFCDLRPLAFFGGIAILLFGLSLTAGIPVIFEYLETGLVMRLPLAVLAVGLGLVGTMSLIGGVILSSINRRATQLAALIGRR